MHLTQHSTAQKFNYSSVNMYNITLLIHQLFDIVEKGAQLYLLLVVFINMGIFLKEVTF